MSERLYYTDSYITKFQAQIVERIKTQDRLAIVLDQTYFYPTSGGQPFDTGHIAGTPVVDVTLRESDDAILHHMAGEVWANQIVAAEVNWERRFDHIQQHSGQHILSQAFLRIADAQTVSFHLGQEVVSIDLNRVDLNASQVEQVEQLANQIIWENRPVRISFVSLEEARRMGLRKMPPAQLGKLRLVEIESFDLSACGGTHVTHTGEVGMIKLLKLERRNQELRVLFLCGRRALFDYRQKNKVVNKLASDLTIGYWDLEQTVGRLVEENKQLQSSLKKQQLELMHIEVESLRQQGHWRGGMKIISKVFMDRDPAHVRLLAARLADTPGVVALLGIAGTNARLFFARAGNLSGDMNQLLKTALQLLGSTAGGGTPSFAQGGGVSADVERVQMALTRAERVLLGQTKV